MARLEKNNICVRFQLSTASGSTSTYKPPDYMDFRVKIGSTTTDKSYNWAASQPWVSSRTVYWTGSLNEGTKLYAYAGAHDVGGAVFSHHTYLNGSNKAGPAYLTPKYTITYYSNNGAGTSTTQSKTWGYAVNLNSCGWTKSGHTFVKWNTKADGSGTSYSAGQSYSTNANLTLYAVWAANTYAVNYNANGGTGTTESQTKTYNVTLALRANGFTAPTGHHFVKWNTKADGTGTSYSAGGSYTANAAATLYAIWAKDTYQVTFDGNGADGGAQASETKTYGSRLVMPGCTFTRTGHAFTEWNTAADGTGTSYTEGSYYETEAAVTLYAQWRKLNIPVYINDGGTVKQVEKAYINDSGTIKECTVYINDNGTIIELS
jgi:uncharacterized repeat protein (TIGR02543 family)